MREHWAAAHLARALAPLAMTLALGRPPPAQVPAPIQARCQVSAPELHWMSLLSWLALVLAHELWARGLVPRQACCRGQGRARQKQVPVLRQLALEWGHGLHWLAWEQEL